MRDEDSPICRYKKMKKTRKSRWTVKKEKKARSSTQPWRRERRVLNRNRTYGVLQWNEMKWNEMRNVETIVPAFKKKKEKKKKSSSELNFFSPIGLSFHIKILNFYLSIQSHCYLNVIYEAHTYVYTYRHMKFWNSDTKLIIGKIFDGWKLFIRRWNLIKRQGQKQGIKLEILIRFFI